MEYDIRAYGGSKRGRSHEINGKPCQDSSHFGLHPDFPNIAILIVADGVGSAERSEEGSRIAVDTVKAYLEGIEPPFTPEIIREAYDRAWAAIDKHTEEGTGWPCDYDTTLSTAVFDAETGVLTYGHSGDGAILAIGMDGIVESITTPQKGAEANSVKPLRDIFSWDFGQRDGPYVSVMAMTDGILDLLMPGLLKLTDEPIYVRLVSWLADFKFFEKKGTPIEESFAKRLNYLYSDIHSGMTNDDLTFVAAMNIHVSSKYRGDEYYRDPDWVALNEEWKRKAYPSLYGEDGAVADEPSNDTVDEPIQEPVKEDVPQVQETKPVSDVIDMLAAARRMLAGGMFNHARNMFWKAAKYGDSEALAYLDPTTLGDLDTPGELVRCRMIASNDVGACLKLADYWRSKGELQRSNDYLRKARLMDPNDPRLEGYLKGLESLSVSDRPR